MKERLTPKLSLPETTTPAHAEDSSLSAGRPGDDAERPRSSNSGGARPVQLGLLILALLGIVGLGIYTLQLNARLAALDAGVNTLQAQRTNAQDNSARVTVAITGLNERTTAIERKLDAVAASVSAAATQADLQAAVESFDDRLRDLSGRISAATTAPAAAAPPAPAAQQAWVVHLATLSDAGAADKFAAKARDLGIDIQQERITVNDNPMYRMSIVDVVSYDEAEKLAAKAQRQLGLAQKPWIAKR